jgi:hypothetical protein
VRLTPYSLPTLHISHFINGSFDKFDAVFAPYCNGPFPLTTYTIRAHSLDTGYVLLEYVKSPTSSMLSSTWDQYRHDLVRRENIFRGISNIMLSISRKSWSRIGSLAFYDNATIGLTNRPLSCTLIIFETWAGVPKLPRKEI